VNELVDREICYWSEYNIRPWSTTCGNYFDFNDGGPDHNGFNYCPYCGKLLIEVPYEEVEDEHY